MAKPLMEQKSFEDLDLASKNDVVQNALLNSIYEYLREGKPKLPDMVKSQTMLMKYFNRTTRSKDSSNNFIATPSPIDPEDTNDSEDL